LGEAGAQRPNAQRPRAGGEAEDGARRVLWISVLEPRGSIVTDGGPPAYEAPAVRVENCETALVFPPMSQVEVASVALAMAAVPNIQLKTPWRRPLG
jgi:hypothetical protein